MKISNVFKIIFFSLISVSMATSDPLPANETISAPIDTTLNWTADSGDLSYDVYFGASESVVTSTLRHLGDIDGDGDVNIDDLSILSSQWLTDPGPVNQSADIVANSTTVDLEDFTALAVDWGLTTNAVFKGNQIDTTYDPGTLDYGTTYYWRIDTVDAAGTTTGVVWNFTTESLAAFNPSPVNGASNVPIDTILSWTAGTGAYFHKVYFGTDSTLDSSDYKSNVSTPSYNPGILTSDITYYWRIDEFNASGTTTGPVWSFSTGLTAAINPFPADGANDVSLNALLSWTGAGEANYYKVYFGTDSTPDSSEYKGDQAETSYDPGTLTSDTTYYWQIDRVTSSGTITGAIWSFSTETIAAVNPSPADGANDVSLDALLSWTGGGQVNYYKVYFGTDSIPDSSEYKVDQIETSYDPGTLSGNKTYYWRIDRVSSSGTITGTVWSFSTIINEWFGYLYACDDQGTYNDIPSVGSYTNMNHMFPNATGVQSAVANGTKVLLDVKWWCFEEEGYHDFRLKADWQSQLDAFRSQYYQYRDHIAALTPVDEPYWHQIERWEVEAVAARLRTDFPGIPIYLNLWRSSWGGTSLLEQTSYPAGIDWIAFDNFDLGTFDYSKFLTYLDHLKNIRTSSQKIILNAPNMEDFGTDAQQASWTNSMYNLMQNDSNIIGILVWLSDGCRYAGGETTPLPQNRTAQESIGHTITGK